MRVLGLDYGSKTVGVAVSDAFGWTAQGVEIIRRSEENKLRRTYARIEELIREYGVTKIVLGCPFHMDGSAGERVAKTESFRQGLERRTGLPAILWDERLTTVAAEETMREAGVKRERRKDYVDMLAAGFILQEYLDSAAENEKKERSQDGRKR